jgi:hypothetical protein
MTATQIKSIKTWHHAIIDEIIALGPNFSLAELSRRTNYSIAWLSILLNSDLFKAALSKRRAALAALIDQDINAKLSATTNVALDRMRHLLSTAQTLEEVNESADLLLRSLGYGVKGSAPPPHAPQTNLQVNIAYMPDNVVSRARAQIGKKHEPNLLSAPAGESSRDTNLSDSNPASSIQETRQL